jgi:hypothetical protein
MHKRVSAALSIMRAVWGGSLINVSAVATGCFVIAACFVSQARADSIPANFVRFLPAYGSSAIIDTTQTFSGQDPNVLVDPSTLDIGVDYAVFAPGNFPSALDPNTGDFSYQTSTGTNKNLDYIYAYQIFNIGDTPNPQSVSELSVSFNPDLNPDNSDLNPKNPGPPYPIWSVGESNPLNVSSSLAVPTSFDDVIDDATQFHFDFGTIAPGQESWLLLYSSPIPPGSSSAYIIGGLAQDTEDVGSPVVPSTQIMVTSPVPLPRSVIQIFLMLMIPLIGAVVRMLPYRRISKMR